MTNKFYKRGREKEYRIMKKLREEGFDIVLRSAGSHSPIDVVAIKSLFNEIRFIQSKPSSMSWNAKERLEEAHKWLNNKFNVTFEVI